MIGFQGPDINQVYAFPELTGLQKRLHHQGMNGPTLGKHVPDFVDVVIARGTENAFPLLVANDEPDLLDEVMNARVRHLLGHENLENLEHMVVQCRVPPQSRQISHICHCSS